MKIKTLFKAYIKARDKERFYLAQQGGDYSKRRRKVKRQIKKLEKRIFIDLDWVD